MSASPPGCIRKKAVTSYTRVPSRTQQESLVRWRATSRSVKYRGAVDGNILSVSVRGIHLAGKARQAGRKNWVNKRRHLPRGPGRRPDYCAVNIRRVQNLITIRRTTALGEGRGGGGGGVCATLTGSSNGRTCCLEEEKQECFK